MKRREGTTSVVRIPPQRGEGRLAGGERSGPPARRRITICTPAGVAGAPRAPAGARWSRRHGFQGFAKGAHPWLSSSRSERTARLKSCPPGFHSQWEPRDHATSVARRFDWKRYKALLTHVEFFLGAFCDQSVKF